MSLPRPQVSLVAIATGRYRQFVPELIEGARRYILGLDRIFIISDVAPRADEPVVWLPWGHLPWPYPTLLRYRAMTAYRDVLAEAETLLYLDIDMRIQQPIELERLEGTIAVQHPGYVGTPVDDLPYERRHQSMSSIAPGEGSAYFAGGVQGGGARAYLQACATIAAWIQQDLETDVIPCWHDESAWNRYCATYPPELVLDRRYCSPEYEHDAQAVIVALDKDHDHLREVPLSTRLGRRWQRAKASARRRAGQQVRRLKPTR